MSLATVPEASTKTLELPFRYVELPSVGKVFYPYIPVYLKTVKGWKDFDFIVDTGADFTTLPRRAENILGLDLNQCKESKAEGIGGVEVKTWETQIPIRLKNFEFTVRCSITEDDKTPFLLGRIDNLDKIFSWIFDADRKKIIFKKIRTSY